MDWNYYFGKNITEGIILTLSILIIPVLVFLISFITKRKPKTKDELPDNEGENLL